MTTVIGRRANRIADARRRVIDVALELFGANGFRATTVEEICAGAGISRASFFRYFENKEAVLFAQIVGHQQWVLEEIRNRPAGERAIASVVAVCVEGEWPELNRQRLRKLRRIMSADPALVEAQRIQRANAFTPQLQAILREREPNRPAIEIRLATDLAASWTYWAFVAHMHDGRPLAEHFNEVFAVTKDLAHELDVATKPARPATRRGRSTSS